MLCFPIFNCKDPLLNNFQILFIPVQREVEKSDVHLASLKEDVIKGLKKSGWEKLLRNQVYAHLNRSIPNIY